MREIKFRAWDKTKLQWLNTQLFTVAADTGLIYTIETPYAAKTAESLQSDFVLELYTGLKDKSGIEIFEGDILRDRGEIKWDYDLLCHLQRSENAGHDEVIGNIHENPELLKE